MKLTAIIQARMGATRLPGKVLMEVMGKPILAYVVERIKRAHNIYDIIIATTNNRQDLAIVHLADKLEVKVYAGSEDDVLDRFYQAALLFKTNHIVRITADCPLIDPKVIDRVIDCYFESGADYCSNVLEVTFPDGQDTEVFSLNCLSAAWREASLSSDREHVTPYIKKNKTKFKLVNLRNKDDLSANRWTLDRKEDFEFIKAVLEALYPLNPDFTMEDILRFLERYPHLEALNKGIERNEAYKELA